ncbi:AAA family ATPase [Listeria rustica]|uniref:AAA family ATPase n=1 Tax=Listeria rustica TaxID=2713503 RepID=A0A7W1T6Q0_9LIST|nr:AAA family ATPase [Listeria rustica]MBA3926399.1 AAA family ATPase [Listeria rustica]
MITFISVKKIFGEFDYDVDLSNKIRIIIGPNGSGKTTFFKIVNAVLSKRHIDLYEFEFEKILIRTNKGNLSIEKTIFTNEQSEAIVNIKYCINDIEVGILEENELPHLSYFARQIPRLSRSRDYVYDIETKEVFTTEDKYLLIEKYANYLPNNFFSIPEAVLTFLENLNVTTIFTDRLQDKQILRGEMGSDLYQATSVEYCLNDIKKKISRYTTDYAEYSRKLDQQFPLEIVRVLNGDKASNLDFEIIEELSDIIGASREKLIKTGLFDINEDKDESYLHNEFDKMNQQTLIVLEKYFKTMKKKMDFLLPFSDKIEMILELFNKKIASSGKVCRTNYKEGFYIENKSKNNTIPFEKLSSGEQHEFIQLYSLIFEVSNGDVILIDEPEISIHVSWQRDYIEDLNKILNGRDNVKVIIATHSAQIVNNYWEDVLDLGAIDK